MANEHKIKIKEGFSDGSLKLFPRHTYAKNKELIRWTIKDDSGVTSIEKIEQKSGINIFTAPPRPDGKEWVAEIKDGLPDDCEYEYKICWNGKFGKKETDPKISVNPTDGDFMKVFIGVAIAVFAAILTLGFFRWKKSRN